MLVYKGTLIKDSLLDEAFLNFVSITKEDPPCLYFTVGEDFVASVAEEISKSLKPRGWCAQIENEYSKLVIFPNKILKFAPTDAAARGKAIEYGKSLGLSDIQMKGI